MQDRIYTIWEQLHKVKSRRTQAPQARTHKGLNYLSLTTEFFNELLAQRKPQSYEGITAYPVVPAKMYLFYTLEKCLTACIQVYIDKQLISKDTPNCLQVIIDNFDEKNKELDIGVTSLLPVLCAIIQLCCRIENIDTLIEGDDYFLVLDGVKLDNDDILHLLDVVFNVQDGFRE